jgi:Skp family chaperone for outer membrane proteins
MKKYILIGLLLFTGLGAFAQKFAYVDTEYILKHLPEYKSSLSQLNVYLNNGSSRLIIILQKLIKCIRLIRLIRFC